MKTEKFNCIPFIRINDWLNFTAHGWGNGYVAVDETHPLFGKEYDSAEIEVHGGLTFSDQYSDNLFNAGEVIGSEKPTEKHWVFGFDTAHWNDTADNWPKERVIEETMKLKEQLESFSITV